VLNPIYIDHMLKIVRILARFCRNSWNCKIVREFQAPKILDIAIPRYIVSKKEQNRYRYIEVWLYTEGLTNCDGTCTDLLTDDRNCGQCSTTCELDCASGTCNECSYIFWPGWVLCPNQLGHDYCTSLSDDIANCGKCGNACGSLETCSNSICVSDIDWMKNAEMNNV
jgi:hypothetical protein